jgi:hypothetical protein
MCQTLVLVCLVLKCYFLYKENMLPVAQSLSEGFVVSHVNLGFSLLYSLVDNHLYAAIDYSSICFPRPIVQYT